MTFDSHSDAFILPMFAAARRFSPGYGDIISDVSWTAPPSRPKEKFRLLAGNFLHAALAGVNPAWSAVIDYDSSGEPSALVLTSGPGRWMVLDIKISTEVLRIFLPDGRKYALPFQAGGLPIAGLLTDICAEFYYGDVASLPITANAPA